MCRCDFNHHCPPPPMEHGHGCPPPSRGGGYVGFGQIPDVGCGGGFGQIPQGSLWGRGADFAPPPAMNFGMFGGGYHGCGGFHNDYFFDGGFGDSKMGKGLGKAAVKSAEYNGIANIIGASTGIVGIFANWFSR